MKSFSGFNYLLLTFLQWSHCHPVLKYVQVSGYGTFIFKLDTSEKAVLSSTESPSKHVHLNKHTKTAMSGLKLTENSKTGLKTSDSEVDETEPEDRTNNAATVVSIENWADKEKEQRLQPRACCCLPVVVRTRRNHGNITPTAPLPTPSQPRRPSSEYYPPQPPPPPPRYQPQYIGVNEHRARVAADLLVRGVAALDQNPPFARDGRINLQNVRRLESRGWGLFRRWLWQRHVVPAVQNAAYQHGLPMPVSRPPTYVEHRG